MFLNKIKFLNKNYLYVRQLLELRSFLSMPFIEINKFPKSVDCYEKLYQVSIFEAFWSSVAKSRVNKETTGEKFNEILQNQSTNRHNQPINTDYSKNDLFSETCNFLLTLLKYLEKKSLHTIVKYVY